MNAERLPDYDHLSPSPETCERGRVMAILERVREREEKGLKEIWAPEEAWYVTGELFRREADRWKEKAGEFDGAEYVAMEASQLPHWMRDRRVMANVSRCWEWFGSPQINRDTGAGIPPWRTILANAERGADRSREERDHYIRGQIVVGARRHLMREFLQHGVRGVLRAALSGALSELVKDQGWEEVTDLDGEACFRPGQATWLPRPELDLEQDPGTCEKLVARIGKRSAAGGTHSTTHAKIPPRKSLMQFISDACEVAEAALSDVQLFHLAVGVFEIDLQPPQKVPLEPEREEGDGRITGGIQLTDGFADASEEKGRALDRKRREPFPVIVKFAEKLVALLTERDGWPVEAPMEGRMRGKWLGPLFFRYYLWRKWGLWDEHHEPERGRKGIPLVYGVAKAAALLGKSTAQLGAFVSGEDARKEKLKAVLEQVRERLDGKELPVFEGALREACADADAEYGFAVGTTADGVESGRAKAKLYVSIIGRLPAHLPKGLLEKVEGWMRANRAEGGDEESAGVLMQAIEEAFRGEDGSPGLEDEDERDRVEDYLRCRYFHLKPEFVNPANFNPQAVMASLQ